MNCLVTGGAGFIGSVLVDELIKRNNKVIVIDNESAEENEQFYWNENALNYKYDICDYDKIDELFENIRYVFHLAAQSRIQPSILNPTKTNQVNYYGTKNILEASKKYKVDKIIYSSSSSVYGIRNKPPLNEDMARDCLNPYASSKAAGEDLCNKYYKKYGLKSVILRYFNVFGKRQPIKGDYAPIIGKFLKQKKEKKNLTIVGDGSQKRDYIHVVDVVRANILAAKVDCLGGEIFNIGTGKNYSVLDIAKMINYKYEFIPKRDGEAFETLANIYKAKDKLKWGPKINIEDWLKGV